MGNPYTPSTSTASSTASNSQSPSEPPSRKTLSLIATAASALAIVVFVVVAAMLIPQAMRLGVEESGLPPRYQNGGGGMVQASWIGGLVAVAGACQHDWNCSRAAAESDCGARNLRCVSDRIDGDCGYVQTLGKFKRAGTNKGERMRLPIVSGVIERRILANYRVDPARLAAVLPAPFRPQIVNGYGIGGICLIRLINVRPKFLPIHWGVRSENAAHRIAVEWETDGTLMHGVYVPRRDTNSRLNVLAGGRIFPGLQHHASFAVNESLDRFDVRMKSDDWVARVHVSGRVAKALPAGSVFESLDTASAFFAQGSIGYSATQSQSRFDGMELRCANWQVEALDVDAIASSYFEDAVRFPAGSVEFDCALLMRNVVHEWHSREEICCAAQIEPAHV